MHSGCVVFSIPRVCLTFLTCVGLMRAAQLQADEPPVEQVALSPAPQRLENTTLMAIVGSEPILLADIRPEAEQILRQAVGDRPVSEAELANARTMLIRKVLVKFINMKVMYRGFIESLAPGEAPDKAKDAEQQVRMRARKWFYEKEVPRQLKDRKLDDLIALDRELRKSGTSVEQLERQFIELMAGSTYMSDEIPKEPLVTPVELKDYYRDHGAEFDRPARARWEQLTVLFERFASREEARAQIEKMGDEALFGGNLQAVARRQSQEVMAEKGGVHEWTRQGSLRSKPLDQAIFSLPPNKMSTIIEDDQGYHIIRVLERQPAGRMNFSDAQEEIRKKIQDAKREELHAALMKKIRAAVPVWSMFPDDYPGALPLSALPR